MLTQNDSTYIIILDYWSVKKKITLHNFSCLQIKWELIYYFYYNIAFLIKYEQNNKNPTDSVNFGHMLYFFVRQFIIYHSNNS